jgi:hypothetical protein
VRGDYSSAIRDPELKSEDAVDFRLLGLLNITRYHIQIHESDGNSWICVFLILAVLALKLRALHLLGRHSNPSAMLPAFLL